MTAYRYKSVAPSGEMREGEIEALSQAEAIEKLHDLGHVPLRAEKAATAGGGGIAAWLRRDLFAGRRVSEHDIGLMTGELALLSGAGLPLDQCLDTLTRLMRNERMKQLLVGVRDSVRGGASLADALDSSGESFPPYYVSMVRAGEASGSLDAILSRLADFIDRAVEMKERVKSALIYPMILLLLAGVSVAVLLTVVIPEFKPLFEDAGESLPLLTQVVMTVGAFIQDYWWAMALAAAGLVILGRQLLSVPSRRLVWDRWVLALPLFGDLVGKLETARLSRMLGTLLGNGVPMLEALSLARATLANRALAAAIARVADAVQRGGGLAGPLAESKLFPDLAVDLVRVGEESGHIETMLLKIADIYERESQRTIDRMITLLVPLLTIGLGALIAGIIASILFAILGVNSLAL